MTRKGETQFPVPLSPPTRFHIARWT